MIVSRLTTHDTHISVVQSNLSSILHAFARNTCPDGILANLALPIHTLRGLYEQLHRPVMFGTQWIVHYENDSCVLKVRARNWWKLFRFLGNCCNFNDMSF